MSGVVPPSFVKMHSLLIDYYTEEIASSHENVPRLDKDTKQTEEEAEAKQKIEAMRRVELEKLWDSAIEEMSKLDPSKAVDIWVKLLNRSIKEIFDNPDKVEEAFGGWKRVLIMKFNAIFLDESLDKFDSRCCMSVKGYWKTLQFANQRKTALPASRFMMGRSTNANPNVLIFRYANKQGEVKDERLLVQLDKKFHYQDGRIFNSVESFIETMEKEKGVKGISEKELSS